MVHAVDWPTVTPALASATANCGFATGGYILASKNANNKFLHGNYHLILLYLLVSDFSINFEKKNFLIRTILSFLFFIPYTRGVARADFLVGAAGAVFLARFR